MYWSLILTYLLHSLYAVFYIFGYFLWWFFFFFFFLMFSLMKPRAYLFSFYFWFVRLIAPIIPFLPYFSFKVLVLCLLERAYFFSVHSLTAIKSHFLLWVPWFRNWHNSRYWLIHLFHLSPLAYRLSTSSLVWSALCTVVIFLAF